MHPGPTIPGEMPNLMEGDALPPFANAHNKRLDAEIKVQQGKVDVLKENINDNATRIKVMSDHLTNVQQELIYTQQLVDAKRKEIDTDEHMASLAKRQIGRIEDLVPR